MDFYEFQHKLLIQSTYVNRCTFLNYRSGIYHLILHKSRFREFILELDQNITVLEYSVLWRNDHIHLLIYMKQKIKSLSNFKILPVKNARYIYRNFISGGKERHDLICNASFKVLSLQILSMNIILKKLHYLHNMFQLDLPNLLYKKLFKQSQIYFSIPSYADKSFDLNELTFSKDDCVYTKEFVSWIQRKRFLVFHNFSYIQHQFISHDNKIYNFCLKCMNFEMEDGKFIKISELKPVPPFDTFSLSRNPLNWCHACKQVPLFYIPMHPCLLCKSDFNNYEKTDYYEDGRIVKSIPRRSRRIRNKYKKMCNC